MARTQRRRSAAAPAPIATGETAATRTARARRENLPRPAAAAPQAAAGVPRPQAVPRRRRNPLAFLGRFEPRWVTDIIAELRKVTWPSWDETRHLTIVVSIVATVVGVSLGLIDLGFGWVIQKLLF